MKNNFLQSGVRRKTLAMKSGGADCPKEKVISKKCKNGEHLFFDFY